MASLCENLFERQLKRPFIYRSAFVLDNGGVKNIHPPITHGVTAKLAPVTAGLKLAGITRWAACGVLALCATAWHGGAVASGKGDHERALQAVQSGQVLPLAKVLTLIEREQPGQVMEVELESHDQQWQYEIKLLLPDGRLMKFKVDARTGEVLKRKTR